MQFKTIILMLILSIFIISCGNQNDITSKEDSPVEYDYTNDSYLDDTVVCNGIDYIKCENGTGYCEKSGFSCCDGHFCNGICYSECENGNFQCTIEGGSCCGGEICNDICYEKCETGKFICGDEPHCEDDNIIDNTSNYATYSSLEMRDFDSVSKCGFDASVTIDGMYLGNMEKGIFFLPYNTYLEKFKNNSLLVFTGNTSDCFSDKNIPFLFSYYVYNLSENYENDEPLEFQDSFNLRSPTNFGTMQYYIRPNDVFNYTKKFKFTKDDTRGKIQELIDVDFAYFSDSLQFYRDYWQFPNETLKSRRGDCEDWAFLALSLIKSYNNSLNCYNSVFPTHVSIFCFFDREFVIYEEDGSRHNVKYSPDLTNYDNKKNIRDVLFEYFDYWGLSQSQDGLVILDNTKIITFNSNQEFVDFAYETLKSRKAN